MNFLHWQLLFLLVLPFGLIVWIWLRQNGEIVMPFDHGRQKKGRVWKFFLNIAESVPALLLVAPN